MAKRLIEFLRSVLPADPYQLLLLAGVVCLSTVRGLKWWPAFVHVTPDRVANSFGRFVLDAGAIFMLPVLFAAAAGYFVCFWPGKHPIRRIVTFVVFPSVVTIILTLGRFIYLAGPPSSILQGTGATVVGKLNWLQTLGLESLGLQVALIGLLLILLFVLRLGFGISRLPLTLSSTRADSNELASWCRVLALIWFLIALESVIGRIPLASTAYSFPGWLGKPLFLAAALNASSLCTFAIALLVAGPDARRAVWESIAVPKYKWTGFALFFPIAIDMLLSIAQRAANGFRITSGGSNTTPRGFFITFLLLLLPAFFEEGLFRGLLQKRLIRRYGMYRGIFLVCIVWAAFHFYSDFSSPHDSYPQILYRLTGRIVMTVGIGFVLSWLTLQSRTIVPATLSHALYNALVFSPPGFVFMGMSSLRTMLWAAFAMILFRYWPIPTARGTGTIPPEEPSPQSGSPQSGDDDAPSVTA